MSGATGRCNGNLTPVPGCRQGEGTCQGRVPRRRRPRHAADAVRRLKDIGRGWSGRRAPAATWTFRHVRAATRRLRSEGAHGDRFGDYRRRIHAADAVRRLPTFAGVGGGWSGRPAARSLTPFEFRLGPPAHVDQCFNQSGSLAPIDIDEGLAGAGGPQSISSPTVACPRLSPRASRPPRASGIQSAYSPAPPESQSIYPPGSTLTAACGERHPAPPSPQPGGWSGCREFHERRAPPTKSDKSPTPPTSELVHRTPVSMGPPPNTGNTAEILMGGF